MPLEEIQIGGYRSVRKLRLKLGQLNVITGPNGSGKSNLYRALWLIARIAEGDFAQTIAKEGGLLSAMWAGPRTSKKPLRMSLGFRLDGVGFSLESGFPPIGPTFFGYDPQIKKESIWIGTRKLPSMTLAERCLNFTWLRDTAGNRADYPSTLSENESILSQVRDPHRFPELFMLRDQVRQWRFYHQFRTDELSPLRFPQVSVKTTILSHDGSDLAATLMTIMEMGDWGYLREILSLAFPGRNLVLEATCSDPREMVPGCTELVVAMKVNGVGRNFLARELSDGTLKFLCLAAALLSPRPPAFIALNEPEASLHVDLIPALAQLIVEASRFSQIWVTTHSQILAKRIEELSGTKPFELSLVEGETVVQDEFEDEQDDVEDTEQDG